MLEEAEAERTRQTWLELIDTNGTDQKNRLNMKIQRTNKQKRTNNHTNDSILKTTGIYLIRHNTYRIVHIGHSLKTVSSQ